MIQDQPLRPGPGSRGGWCPDGTEPVAKTVAALPGNTVELTDVALLVNGLQFPRTTTLSTDREGREVRSFPCGIHAVGGKEVWLSTSDPRSWDSRYYGPIPLQNIRSAVRPLVTLAAPKHTREQGFRVHQLADRGGLVSIAGLDSLPPDLLLGALLVVVRRLRRMQPESLEQVRKLGDSKLSARAAQKRAWKAYKRASDIGPVYHSAAQLRALISALGGTSPGEDSALAPALLALLREVP